MAAATQAAARAGLAVFPLHHQGVGGCSCGTPACSSPGKHPLHTGWQSESTVDPASIDRLWRATPLANVGVDCEKSGIVVIDVDPRHRGERTLLQIEGKLGALPPAPSVLTSPDKRGVFGQHLYLHAPREPIPSAIGGLGPGVDVKAIGGLVVGAGSLHASGHRYAWAPGRTPDDLAFPTLPDAWIVRLRAQAEERQRRPSAGEDGAPIPNGVRNTTLVRLAGGMRRVGMTATEIAAALGVINRDRCQPPLDEAEVQRIATSISRYPPAPARPLFRVDVPRTPLISVEVRDERPAHG
jgi:putative DNA primase/helicase